MKKFHKIASIMIAAVMAFTVVFASAGQTYAASGKYVLGVGMDDVVYVSQETSAFIYHTEKDVDVRITSLASSNKKILKVKKYDAWDENNKKFKLYRLTGVAPGKVKITAKYKVKGKVKTITQKITVKKYPKHIKSLKINGKNIKLTGENRFIYSKKYKKTSATVKMALNKGWKITNVYGSYWNSKTGKSVNIKNAKKLVKGGKKISFPKKYSGMYLDIEMKKGNQHIFYTIDFWR